MSQPETPESEKPEIVLADTKRMSFESVLDMFRRLSGREPTPAEVEEARAIWEAEYPSP